MSWSKRTASILFLVLLFGFERKVVVPNLEKGQLNTWEKTKKQFMKSTNLLLAALSGLIVFILGNLPILIIFVLLGFLGYLYYKKKKSQNKRE